MAVTRYGPGMPDRLRAGDFYGRVWAEYGCDRVRAGIAMTGYGPDMAVTKYTRYNCDRVRAGYCSDRDTGRIWTVTRYGPDMTD